MHYSQHPLQGFNQFVFNSRMAAKSKNRRLNFGIVLLALHEPLDIAEQLASLDVISKGRVIFGAALGYRDTISPHESDNALVGRDRLEQEHRRCGKHTLQS